MRARSLLAACAAAITLVGAGASVASADDITNTIDTTVDAAAETMPLNIGATGSTTLSVITQNGDGKNGCNLTGGTTFSADVASSNTKVATVSPSSVTFTSCSDTKILTVTPLSVGTADITLSQTGNTTSGSFNLAPATFTVNVSAAAPSNTAPKLTITGVSTTPYAYGSTVSPLCNVDDAEDGKSSFPATVTANADVVAGIGTFTASCSFTDSGGLLAQASTTFVVEKAQSTVTVSCPSTVTYDGKAQEPCSATVKGNQLDTTAAVTYTPNVNAGTVTASAEYAGSATHLSSAGSATFTIQKASSTTTVTCPTSASWTGSAVTPCTARVTGAGGLDMGLTPSYTDNVSVGTGATASAAFTGDDNHTASSDTKTFEIGKAPSKVTVTCTAGQVYTGIALTPCTATVTSAGGFSDSLLVNYADNLDATGDAEATATASFGGDATHASASGSATFTIAKASSNVTVSCPTSVTYDATAQTPCTATASGVGMKPVTGLTVGYSNNTNAGTATATSSWGGDANHTDSTANTTFKIAQAPSEVAVTCPTSVVYKGAEQKPCTATATGLGMDDVALVPSYTDNTNAGTASASAIFAGDANHLRSTGSTTFEITQAPSKVEITCPASIVYNGSEQTPCTAKATGVGMDDVALKPSYTGNTDAGAANVSATWAGDANHLDSTGSKTFEIAQAPSEVAITCPTSVVYNSSAQTPCSARVTGAGGLSQAIDVDYSGNVSAGTATALAVYEGDLNHVGSTGSETFEITKATPSVDLSCTSATYDAAAHPCSASVTGIGAELTGIPAIVTYSRGGTATTDVTSAGTVEVLATYAGSTNYTAASKTASLVIAKATPVVSLDCPTAVVYDGTAHPCTGAVKGLGDELSGAPVAITYSRGGTATTDVTSVGTVGVLGSYAGSSNYTAASRTGTVAIGAWTTKGFYQPVDMNGTLNTVKAGSTVPLKFELFAGATEKTGVSDVASFRTQTLSCQGLTALTDDIEMTTTGGTSLRYDTTGGQFIQNWQTPKTVGVCYAATMTGKDGTQITAYFKTK
jgi:hypothetical protein